MSSGSGNQNNNQQASTSGNQQQNNSNQYNWRARYNIQGQPTAQQEQVVRNIELNKREE